MDHKLLALLIALPILTALVGFWLGVFVEQVMQRRSNARFLNGPGMTALRAASARAAQLSRQAEARRLAEAQRLSDSAGRSSGPSGEG